MPFRKFISATLAGTAGLLLAATLFSFQTDYFSVFHSAEGRKIRIYSDERLSKYLLMRNYVPDNFDAILLGASGSDVLDTDQFHACKVYNGSLRSGDILELSSEIGPALERRKLRLAILNLRPNLFHGKPANFPEGLHSYRTALLSQVVFTNYFMDWQNWLFGVPGPAFDESGDWQKVGDELPSWSTQLTQARGEIRRRVVQESSFLDTPIPVDQASINQFSEMLKEIRRRNLKILVYRSPVPSELYSLEREKIAAAFKQIDFAFSQDDAILDFNQGCLASISEDLENFADADHLSVKGGNKVVRVLDEAVRHLLAGEAAGFNCPQVKQRPLATSDDPKGLRAVLDYLLTMSRAQEQIGRLDQASEYVEAALSLSSLASPEEISKLREMQKIYENNTVVYKTKSLVEVSRGYRERQRGNFVKAKEHFLSALKAEQAASAPRPSILEICGQALGEAYLKEGNLKEALHYASLPIKLRPDRGINHGNLAYVMARAGDFEGARSHFLEAARLGFVVPDDSYLTVAQNLMKHGRITDAMTLVQNVMQVFVANHQENRVSEALRFTKAYASSASNPTAVAFERVGQ